MAAKAFTHGEWKKIWETLEAHPAWYGLPERVYGSVLLGSFNIRKLGSATRRNNDTWEFLADVCRRFDLLAVQEIMDDLGGLRKLQGLMGPEFGMIVSDKTGAFPGEPGFGERLGYIFNRSIVRRTEIATDISYDRSKVLNTLGRYNDEIHEAMAPYAKKLDNYLARLEEYKAGNRRTRPKRPKFKAKMPTFLTFIRTPFCVSFESPHAKGAESLLFLFCSEGAQNKKNQLCGAYGLVKLLLLNRLQACWRREGFFRCRPLTGNGNDFPLCVLCAERA
jgi:hypothetical protein